MAAPVAARGFDPRGGDTRTDVRIGSPALVGTAAAVASAAMGVIALAAFFLGTRNLSGKGFVPQGVRFDNYAAVMAAVSLGLASMAVGWAVTSMKVGNRRWASSGFGLAALLDVAALNLVWTLGREIGPGVRGSEYAVVVYAAMVVAGVFIGAALLSSIAGLVRVLGGQTTAAQPHLGYASAWVQHLGTFAWFVSLAVIYLRK